MLGYGLSDSTEFWVVQNSYGESWAEGGIGRIKRGPICGVDPVGFIIERVI